MVGEAISSIIPLSNYLVCGNSEALGFLSNNKNKPARLDSACEGHQLSRGSDFHPLFQST